MMREEKEIPALPAGDKQACARFSATPSPGDNPPPNHPSFPRPFLMN